MPTADLMAFPIPFRAPVAADPPADLAALAPMLRRDLAADDLGEIPHDLAAVAALPQQTPEVAAALVGAVHALHRLRHYSEALADALEVMAAELGRKPRGSDSPPHAPRPEAP